MYDYKGFESKKVNNQGRKAWQRDDFEDRTIPYKKWLLSRNTGGMFIDADCIKWRTIEGVLVPRAITELTACEWETPATEKYLHSIEDRWFNRDIQGKIMVRLGELLQVPVFLVVFPPSVSWFYVLSFKVRIWHLFTPDSWEKYLQKL